VSNGRDYLIERAEDDCLIRKLHTWNSIDSGCKSTSYNYCSSDLRRLCPSHL